MSDQFLGNEVVDNNDTSYLLEQLNILIKQEQYYEEFVTEVVVIDNQCYTIGQLLLGLPMDTPACQEQDDNVNSFAGGATPSDILKQFRQKYTEVTAGQSSLNWGMDAIIDKVRKDTTLLNYLNTSVEKERLQIIETDKQRISKQIEKAFEPLSNYTKTLSTMATRLTVKQSTRGPIISCQIVKDLYSSYEDLPIEQKLQGLQKVFYQFLKYVWKCFAVRLGLPSGIQFDGIQNLNGLKDKLKEFVLNKIRDSITVKTTILDVKDHVRTLKRLTNLVQSIANVISAQFKKEDIGDKAETLIILSKLLKQLLEDFEKYLGAGQSPLNPNFPSSDELSRHKERQDLKRAINIWEASLKYSTNNGQLPSTVSSLTKAIAQAQSSLESVNNGRDIDVSEVLKSSCEHFAMILNAIPTPSTLNLNVAEMINKSPQIQEVMEKATKKTAEVKEMVTTEMNGLVSQLVGTCKRIWSTITTNFIKINIPLPNIEDVFGMFSICFSFSIDFAGYNFLTLLNIGVMLLHYVIVLNTKPYHCNSNGKQQTICQIRTNQLVAMKQAQNVINSLGGNSKRLKSKSKSNMKHGGTLLPSIVGTAIQRPSSNNNQPRLTDHIDEDYNTVLNQLQKDSYYVKMGFVGMTDEVASKLVKKGKLRLDVAHDVCSKDTTPIINDLFIVNDVDPTESKQSLLSPEQYEKDDVSRLIATYLAREYLSSAYNQTKTGTPLLPSISPSRPFLNRSGGKLTTKKIQEIKDFLNEKKKQELYVYAKSKMMSVSSKMTKQELVDCVVNHHKMSRKAKTN